MCSGKSFVFRTHRLVSLKTFSFLIMEMLFGYNIASFKQILFKSCFQGESYKDCLPMIVCQVSCLLKFGENKMCLDSSFVSNNFLFLHILFIFHFVGTKDNLLCVLLYKILEFFLLMKF